MLNDSRSILAMETSRFLFAIGKALQPQQRRWPYPLPSLRTQLITILQRGFPIRAPIATANKTRAKT